MPTPRYTALVDKLPSTVPFVGPEAQERARGRTFRARIGANESVFGPSPKAVAAMAKAASECWMYGDPENHDIKAALAAHLGVGFDNVVVGEGLDSLFGYTVRMLVEPGDTVVTSLGAYPTFNFHVAGFGGRLVTVPYVDDREDPRSLLDAARRERAKIVFLANPDNPMGSWSHAADIVRLMDELPDGTLLVLDEAYGEFAPPGTLAPLDVTRKNVLRYRTFSKAYGMAGWRIGYAAVPEQLRPALAKVLDTVQICPPSLTQHAAAAALGTDPGWLSQQLAALRPRRRQLLQAVAAWRAEGLPVRLWAEPDGAFYGLLQIEGLGLSSDALMERLVLELRVALVSGRAFGFEDPGASGLGSSLLRLSYGMLDGPDLSEALERLAEGLRRLRQRSEQ